jgi:hypothetical protein
MKRQPILNPGDIATDHINGETWIIIGHYYDEGDLHYACRLSDEPPSYKNFEAGDIEPPEDPA